MGFLDSARAQPRAISQMHGGNISELRAQLNLERIEFIDFSISVNPLGPPASVKKYLHDEQPDPSVYPDPQAKALVEAVALRHQVHQDCVIVGAGAAELLYWLVAFAKPARVLVLEPAFNDYVRAARANGAKLLSVALKEGNDFTVDWPALERDAARSDMLLIGHPNNPTGRLLDRERLINFVDGHPRLMVVVDEAFMDFAPDADGSIVEAATRRPNLVSLRSLTKIYSIPNLRLGYLVGQRKQSLEWQRGRPPWPLGEAQIELGRLALQETGFVDRTRLHIRNLRDSLTDDLTAFKWLSPLKSDVNFLLVKILTDRLDDLRLLEELARQGVFIRACRSFTVLDDRYFRVAVRSENDNRFLIEALGKVGRKYGL